MSVVDLSSTLVAAWRTNNRVTIDLIAQLSARLWDTAVPVDFAQASVATIF